MSNDYYIYGWRQVPVNPKVLGTTAENGRPEIAQVLFRKNIEIETDKLERKFMRQEKKIEKLARNEQLKDFYICSMSSRSIVYKGMFFS